MGKFNGLPYFSLDCQLDDKFGLIEAEYGIKGFAVIIKLFQKIYGNEGYYCEWTKEVALLFARQIGLTNDEGVKGGNVVSDIVNTAIKRDIFNRELYEKYNILTSKRIQQSFLKATQRRVRVSIKGEYLLINVTQEYKNVDIIREIVNTNTKNAYANQQRKGKDRKGKGKEIDTLSITPVEEIVYDPHPALKAIRDYCEITNTDRNIGDKYFNHYESKGWPEKIENWWAHLQLWIDREKTYTGKQR